MAVVSVPFIISSFGDAVVCEQEHLGALEVTLDDTLMESVHEVT